MVAEVVTRGISQPGGIPLGLCLHYHMVSFPLCMSVPLVFFLEGPRHIGSGPHLLWYDLILTNYSFKGLFPNRVTSGVLRASHQCDFFVGMQFNPPQRLRQERRQ